MDSVGFDYLKSIQINEDYNIGLNFFLLVTENKTTKIA